jgi:hypothetical protein
MSDKELNKPTQNPRELTADEIDLVAGGQGNSPGKSTTNTEFQVDYTEGVFNTLEHEDLPPPKHK